METKEILNKLKYLIIGLVGLLKQDGELIDYVDGEIIRLNKPQHTSEVYQIPNKSEKLKLLLISDTHLANKSDRVDILRYLYDKAEQLGVRYVLHSGDFTDGLSNRPEQIYELREPSFEGQVQYCVEKYPQFSGQTYVIQGK